jgi:succinyl-CoA synthetase alpha subunit
MAILVDERTRVLCQGITGLIGGYHAHLMMQYGTHVVAGVSPGKGGKKHLDVPVFDRVTEAVQETRANASIIFVPAEHAREAMVEAIEAEVPLVVVVTERVPALDMVRVRDALKGSRTRLIGPSSQGVLTPEVCKVGVMATTRARPGKIGVVSRSASLTSEVVSQLSSWGLGQSTTIGIGGDPIHGIGFVDCLKLFSEDPKTEGIVLIGEIGSDEEQAAADYLGKSEIKKPIAALVVGRHAPTRRRMGHASALMSKGRGDVEGKIAALESAGVKIAVGAHLVGATMHAAMSGKAARRMEPASGQRPASP